LTADVFAEAAQGYSTQRATPVAIALCPRLLKMNRQRLQSASIVIKCEMSALNQKSSRLSGSPEININRCRQML
jgi:hypothetical protein